MKFFWILSGIGPIHLLVEGPNTNPSLVWTVIVCSPGSIHAIQIQESDRIAGYLLTIQEKLGSIYCLRLGHGSGIQVICNLGPGLRALPQPFKRSWFAVKQSQKVNELSKELTGRKAALA